MNVRHDQSRDAQSVVHPDSVHDAVIATDARLTITAWNRGAELMYGWQADEAIGCGLKDLVRGDPAHGQWPETRERLGAGEAVWLSAVTYHKDGRPIEVEGATVPLHAHLDDARITGYVNVRHDVTERNRANTMHRDAAAQLEMVLTSITDRFFAIDSDWRYTYFNVHAKQQLISLDKDPEALIGKVLWDVFPSPSSEPALRRAMRERVVTNDANYFAPTGQWYENRIYPTINGGLAVFQANITEQREGEQTRRHLVQRLFAAHEEERGRISRELHDDFGQKLTAMSLKVAALQARHRANPVLQNDLLSLDAIVKQLDADVDIIAWQLRPAALDHLGLGAALERYVAGWSAHFEIEADVHVSGPNTNLLTSEAEIALYRIMQEALNNVAKHARANRASVVLQHGLDYVMLTVEDDGAGFEPDVQFAANDTRLGLAGMRERSSLLGGTLDVESRREHGTTVIARIPTQRAL